MLFDILLFIVMEMKVFRFLDNFMIMKEDKRCFVQTVEGK